MQKISDDSPHRIVRDLLERSDLMFVSDPEQRARLQVMRTVHELETMGLGHGHDGDLEFAHLEYDKFQSRVRSRP